MKIVFMGTPDFARESLDKLYMAGHEICAVVTQPDRPSGRGMKLVASPVKTYALEKNLTILQPEKITNNTEFKENIRALKPDLVCVVSYGMLLPKSFLEIPPKGCINVHPSLLPKYRGSAPIQWAVLNGDKTTGVTIMYLNEKMDAGDILMQEETAIGEDETTGQLWDRLSTIGARLLVETVKKIENGTIQARPQPENFTLAPMLNKQMAKIDWKNKNAYEIKNLVRGFNPIMGAYTFYKEKKLKFWNVAVLEEADFIKQVENYPFNHFKDAKNGEVLCANEKIGLFIKARDGIISVKEIQGENAKRMSISDFLRGNSIEIGIVFE